MKKRIKTIDFIKGIAILMIILVHYNQKYTNNIGLFTYFQMGCSIFFVASGWGITQVLKKYDRINKKNIFLFYKSRIKTIAPGWYFAILILYLINIFFNLLNINIDIGNNRNMGDIICNLFFVHGVVPSACNTVVPGGWYIGTTIILYLLSPFIFKILRIFKNKRKVLFVITSAFSLVIWIVLYVLFKESFKYNGFSYFLFLNHYPSFYLGMMLGFDLDDEEQTVQKKQTLFLVIGLVLFILAISVYLVIFSGHDMLSNWMTAMATYFVLYSLICKERKFNGAFLCGRVANIIRKFGENSYFIYLFHTIFAYVFVAEFRKIMLKVGIDTDNMMWFIILIPIIIALSYLFGKIFNMIVNWVMRELDRK